APLNLDGGGSVLCKAGANLYNGKNIIGGFNRKGHPAAFTLTFVTSAGQCQVVIPDTQSSLPPLAPLDTWLWEQAPRLYDDNYPGSRVNIQSASPVGWNNVANGDFESAVAACLALAAGHNLTGHFAYAMRYLADHDKNLLGSLMAGPAAPSTDFVKFRDM